MWDEQWKNILNDVLSTGDDVTRGTKRGFKEIISYKFTLDDPRDRLIFDETRGLNIFQCIGQFLWITQGNFQLEDIKYYQPISERFSSDGVRMIGAYGPRLFGIHHLNQIKHILNILDEDTTRRRAVASIYLPQFDQHGGKDEVPCTLNVQYLVRQAKLNAVTFMRSQDAYLVLPYDVFIFTMLQEYVKAVLETAHDIDLGNYYHNGGSFHVYTNDIPRIKQVISNKSSTHYIMDKMPYDNAEIRLHELNTFETRLRNTITSYLERKVKVDFDFYFSMIDDYFKEKYWRQLALILICYGAIQMKDKKNIEKAFSLLDPIYQYFVKKYLEFQKIQ